MIRTSGDPLYLQTQLSQGRGQGSVFSTSIPAASSQQAIIRNTVLNHGLRVGRILLKVFTLDSSLSHVKLYDPMNGGECVLTM